MQYDTWDKQSLFTNYRTKERAISLDIPLGLSQGILLLNWLKYGIIWVIPQIHYLMLVQVKSEANPFVCGYDNLILFRAFKKDEPVLTCTIYTYFSQLLYKKNWS